MSRRRAALPACLLLAAAGCAGAGADAARARALEARIAALEHELQALRAALQQEGLALDVAEPATAEEALAQGVLRLQAAADRMEAALGANDAPGLERAARERKRALAMLERAPEAQVELLARGRAAPAPRQQALLVGAAAELGGAALAPRLEALAGDRTAPAAARQQAMKALLDGAAPARGLALVEALLLEQPEFPDLYYLVHLAGETRDPVAVPLLCQALAGGTPSVRCHAATALGHFPGPQAATALAAAARGDAHDSVRVNALHALPRAATDRTLVAAVARDVLAAQPSAQVRAAAAQALQAAGGN